MPLRGVDLPAQVDATNAAVKATYDKSILTITLPKAVKQGGRHIKVEAQPAQSRE